MIIDKDWDIISFATQLQNLAGGNVRFDTIPVTSVDGVGDYGESIITVDPDEVKRFFESLLGTKDNPNPRAGETSTPAAPDVTVTVLNASQIPGLAGSVGGWLRDESYRVTTVTNAQEGLYFSSQVVAHSTDDPAAKEIAEKLGNLPITTSPTLDPGSVVVVTASDYAGPQSDTSFEEQDTDTGTDVVGQPGAALEEPLSPTITAEGNRPQCVN